MLRQFGINLLTINIIQNYILYILKRHTISMFRISGCLHALKLGSQMYATLYNTGTYLTWWGGGNNFWEIHTPAYIVIKGLTWDYDNNKSDAEVNIHSFSTSQHILGTLEHWFSEDIQES